MSRRSTPVAARLLKGPAMRQAVITGSRMTLASITWIKDHLISAKRWIYIGSRDFMPRSFSIRALTSAIAFLAPDSPESCAYLLTTIKFSRSNRERKSSRSVLRSLKEFSSLKNYLK